MAEVDEQIAERLMGSEVIVFFFECDAQQTLGDTVTAPQTNFVELNAFDIRVAKEHCPHGSVADR